MNGPFLILNTPPERLPDNILYPFAWDEVMCGKVGAGAAQAVAHIWRHPGAMVLGIRDRRLPNAEQAIRFLRSQGVSVGVRNSGGAAVPLDSGVVNLSLIFPNPPGKVDFHSEFKLMADIIVDAVLDWSGEARYGEIEGSYCPGEYDIAIGGRKFCGIAQRRQLRGIVVSAFIVVEGSGAERGRRALAFYEEATGGIPHPDDPQVSPQSMASLQELAGISSSEAFIDSLQRCLMARGGQPMEPWAPMQDDEVNAMMEQLRRRYDNP